MCCSCRPRPAVQAGSGHRGERARGEHVFAVGLHGGDSLALQPGVTQQATQAGERMLDDAIPCGIERVVTLEEPQAAAWDQRRADIAMSLSGTMSSWWITAGGFTTCCISR